MAERKMGVLESLREDIKASRGIWLFFGGVYLCRLDATVGAAVMGAGLVIMGLDYRKQGNLR